MTIYGYGRVSTAHQELNMQIEALKQYGIPEDRIYTDKKTGKNMERESLKKLLSVVKEGDIIIVKKLDRLGRSVSQVTSLIDELSSKGIAVKSIDDGVDTSVDSTMGRAMLQLLAVFAEMERNFIHERTRPAIEAAKQAGVKFGPKKKNQKEYLKAINLYLNHGYSVPQALAEFTGLTEATFFRRLKEYKEEKGIE